MSGVSEFDTVLVKQSHHESETLKDAGVENEQTHKQKPTKPFRFRDLPEEIQSLIIQQCLPSWSIELYKSAHHLCRPRPFPKISQLPNNRALSYDAPRTPKFKTPLLLVDKRMAEQVTVEAMHRFEGIVKVGYKFELSRGICHVQSDCYCLVPEARRDAKKEALGTMVHAITATRYEGMIFECIDVELQDLLPNLRIVVCSASGVLFDGYIYGFGSQDYLMRNITEEALERLRDYITEVPLRPRFQALYQIRMLEQLWQAGVMTVFEMEAKVGSSTMQFSFVCVYRVEKGTELRPSYTRVGRFAMDKWSTSSQAFKMSVYETNTPSET